MPSFGRIPTRFYPGETPRAVDMTNIARGTRGLLSDSGGHRVNRSMVGGMVTTSFKPSVRPSARRQTVEGLTKACVLILDSATSLLTGDATTQCGYRYDGYDIGVDYSQPDAPKLFDSLEPELGRLSRGWLDPHPNGKWGMARWDASQDSWILWFAPGEKLHMPAPCNPCTP